MSVFGPPTFGLAAFRMAKKLAWVDLFGQELPEMLLSKPGDTKMKKASRMLAF